MWRSKPGPEIDPAASAAKKMSPQGVRDLPKRCGPRLVHIAIILDRGGASRKGGKWGLLPSYSSGPLCSPLDARKNCRASMRTHPPSCTRLTRPKPSCSRHNSGGA